MRTTTAAVEAEIMRRKYGEIGGMYNIKQVYQLRDKTFYEKVLLRYNLFISERVFLFLTESTNCIKQPLLFIT